MVTIALEFKTETCSEKQTPLSLCQFLTWTCCWSSNCPFCMRAITNITILTPMVPVLKITTCNKNWALLHFDQSLTWIYCWSSHQPSWMAAITKSHKKCNKYQTPLSLVQSSTWTCCESLYYPSWVLAITNNHINSYHGSTIQDKFKIWINLQFQYVGSYLDPVFKTEIPLTEIIKITRSTMVLTHSRWRKPNINKFGSISNFNMMWAILDVRILQVYSRRTVNVEIHLTSVACPN